MLRSHLRRLPGLIGVAALTLTTAFLLLRWGHIPASVPIHWGASGQADAWGTRGSLLFPLLLGWLLYGGLSLIARLPWVCNGPGTTERALASIRTMLEVLRALLALSFSWMTLCAAWGRDLGVWFLPVFLLSIFGAILWGAVRALRAR